MPALYIAGEQDFILSFPGMDQHLHNLKHFVPKLRKIELISECGHWTQQECPIQVNAALLEFLRDLPA